MGCTSCRRVECGADKAAHLDRILRRQMARRGQGGAGLAVYVGDSMSDLAPLLSADVGIVIGQNRALRRVAQAAGIRLKSLVCGAGAPLHHTLVTSAAMPMDICPSPQ